MLTMQLQQVWTGTLFCHQKKSIHTQEEQSGRGDRRVCSRVEEAGRRVKMKAAELSYVSLGLVRMNDAEGALRRDQLTHSGRWGLSDGRSYMP